MSTTSNAGVEEMTRGMSMISFKSIIPNAEDVRVTIIDVVPHIWAVDLVLAVKGGTRSTASRDLDAVPQDLFEHQRVMVKKIAGKTGVTTKDAHHVVAGFCADRPRSGAGKHKNEVKGVCESQNFDLPFAVSSNFFENQPLVLKKILWNGV
jgi:hypothetical protein